MLSDADVERYRRDGFVVVPDLLPAAERAALQAVIDGLMAGAAEVDAHDAVYDLEPGHTRAQPRVRRIKTPHRIHPLFLEVVRRPAVLAVLHRLIGPDLRLHGSKLNIKAPHYGSAVEWHQDWAFYPHTNDDLLAIGVMLDDMSLENGPLLVAQGSHRGPLYDHHQDGVFVGAIDGAAIAGAAAQAVPLTGPAGSMSFHHVRALHGSAPNRSARRRQLLLYEVAAADAWPLRGIDSLDEYDGRMLAGHSTVEPRIVPAPVRLPYPPARRQGSIYENQTDLRRPFFAEAAAPP